MKKLERYIVALLDRYISAIFAPRPPAVVGISILALLLGALAIAATRDVWSLQEVPTPDSGDDVIALMKPGGADRDVRNIKIGNLVPKPSDAGLASDVWIAVRTDKRIGDGSQRNPFDGSTQAKFDRLMSSFGRNTVIHLGPGTFQTDIVTRKWRPLSGWKVKGAGMEITTIQAVGNLSGGGNLVAFGLDAGPSTAARSDNVTISDLTVDCNWATTGSTAPVANGQPNCKVGIITLMGSNNVVERVHGKNQYGSSANQRECFGIRLAGFADRPPVSGNIARFCIVDSPQGDYNTPFFLGGGGGIASQCEVYSCQGYGVNDGNGYASTPKTAMLSGGVNIAHLADSKIHDNIFVDCNTIVHHDTGPATNIEVYNNKGIRCSSDGVSSNESVGWRVYNNSIQIQNRNGTQGNYALTFGKATDLQITGNKLTWVSGGNGIGTLWGIKIASGTGTFAGNTIDSHLRNNRVPSTFSVPVGTNKTEAGNLVNGLAETLPPSRNSSTLGALKLTAVVTANPFSAWALYKTGGGTYTIQSGDKLRCEVMSDIHNAVHAPAITITDPNDETDLVDQNGYLGWQEVPDSAGRWLYREFDLTSKAGNSIDHLRIGFRPLAAPAGTYTFYYRYVEIVSSAGATQTYLSDGASAVIVDDSFSKTTGHSVSAINRQVLPPNRSSSHGVPGEWAFDSGYLYMCTAKDTWKRVASSTW